MSWWLVLNQHKGFLSQLERNDLVLVTLNPWEATHRSPLADGVLLIMGAGGAETAMWSSISKEATRKHL